MSCDVAQFLPDDDEPVQEVERLVHLAMTAISVPNRRPRRSFLPPRSLELVVFNQENRQLHLIGYSRKGGDHIAELHQADTKLRALHTHNGHRNPGHGERIDHPHMHFPTVKYPLIATRSTYAYPLDTPRLRSAEETVENFCAELNITVDALQPYLPPGTTDGRR